MSAIWQTHSSNGPPIEDGPPSWHLSKVPYTPSPSIKKPTPGRRSRHKGAPRTTPDSHPNTPTVFLPSSRCECYCLDGVKDAARYRPDYIFGFQVVSVSNAFVLRFDDGRVQTQSMATTSFWQRPSLAEKGLFHSRDIDCLPSSPILQQGLTDPHAVISVFTTCSQVNLDNLALSTLDWIPEESWSSPSSPRPITTDSSPSSCPPL